MEMHMTTGTPESIPIRSDSRERSSTSVSAVPETADSSRRPPAIELHDLVVQYGEHLAVNGLSLTVPAGSIFGFLGPNGAGKTTTIKAMLGLRPVNAGSVHVLGL